MITYSMNDYGALAGISIPVTNHDGTPYDLTGKTVNFKAWVDGSPGSPFINDAAVITDHAGGLAVYTPSQGDITTIGNFPCEAEITEAGSVVSTVSDRLKVVESA